MKKNNRFMRDRAHRLALERGLAAVPLFVAELRQGDIEIQVLNLCGPEDATGPSADHLGPIIAELVWALGVSLANLRETSPHVEAARILYSLATTLETSLEDSPVTH